MDGPLQTSTLPAAAVRPTATLPAGRPVALPTTSLGQRQWLLLVMFGSLGLAAVSLLVRPLLPVDETRYLSVAWDMWRNHSLLLPTLDGVPYEHKPPLLFWLIHAGWALFGVNEWWPRLIAPLCTIAALLGLQRLALRLWPERPQVGRLGTLMLLSSWYLAAYQTGVMFDLLLLACVTWGWLALQRALASGSWLGWMGYGLAAGFGLLAKGPVVLVYLLPPALAWRAWAGSPQAPRLRSVVLAAAVALLLPGLWLVAASQSGTADYFGKLLLEQTLERLHGQLGHPRPTWWYLPLLPLLLLPWLAWPQLWRRPGRLRQLAIEPGVRFVGITAASGFLLLSLASGKQVHYLIPLLALVFLLLARLLVEARPGTAAVSDRVLVRGALASLALVALLLLAVFGQMRTRYDLAAAATYAGAQQRRGRTLAYVGHYQGELGFLGRLERPVVQLQPAAAAAWAARHPEGLVIARRKRLRLRGHPQAEFAQPYKSDQLLMFGASRLLPGAPDPAGRPVPAAVRCIQPEQGGSGTWLDAAQAGRASATAE